VLLVRRGDEGTYVIQSSLAADNKRREKFLKELDPERSELFFARRLLLVEGDTEKLSYPAYAAKLKFDLDRAGATLVEVGGKRNLKDFAELAISFQIPVGIVYDKDTSDFKAEDEEAEYNATLDGLETDDGSVSVWRIDRKHEDAVRRAVGEKKYQELSQRYPNYTNATRQRLSIALACRSRALKRLRTGLVSAIGSSSSASRRSMQPPFRMPRFGLRPGPDIFSPQFNWSRLSSSSTEDRP
jgi:putative ATP-dependent endonuclease of OLD family